MSHDATPLISVIVPVYNGEAFLAQALTSILDQTYAPLEILVIDDGSTDGTAQIAQQFGAAVRYVYRTNGGPAAARNTGLHLAQGSLIAFLDADDLWTQDSLQQQVACLAAHPTAGIALGCLQLLVLRPAEDGTTAFVPWSTPCRLLLVQCALVRATVFAQIGGFDPSYASAEDIDWFMRVREQGIPIATHSATTVLARRHAHNLTRHHAQAPRDLALALKNSIARRQSTQTDSSLAALQTWPGMSVSSMTAPQPGETGA